MEVYTWEERACSLVGLSFFLTSCLSLCSVVCRGKIRDRSLALTWSKERLFLLVEIRKAFACCLPTGFRQINLGIFVATRKRTWLNSPDECRAWHKCYNFMQWCKSNLDELSENKSLETFALELQSSCQSRWEFLHVSHKFLHCWITKCEFWISKIKRLNIKL